MGCEFSTPIPPATAYQKVHPTTGPYLGEGTPAVPNKGGPIQILMKEKAFSSWSGDSFSIRTSNNQAYAGGVNVKGKTLSMRDKMILRDGQNQPIAVCLKQFLNFQVTFIIYAFHPIIANQKPSSHTHEGRRLYQWAKVKDLAFSIQYSMSIWNGTEFVPEYQTNNVGPVMGPQSIAITKRGVDCAMLQQTNVEFFRGQLWNIKIAPGIDPCLIICFVAIVDEMKEDQSKTRRR